MMLRNILICVCCAGALMLTACGRKKTSDIMSLSQNEVYFFYQENCSHCHDAAAYIKENHPNLKIKGLDIKMPGNMRMFRAAARGYKIGFAVGTPLICFGKNYMIGWGADSPKQFDIYAKNYE